MSHSLGPPVLVLALLLLPGAALASGGGQSLGVTPAQVTVEEAQQGHTYHAHVVVQNEFDSATEVSLEVSGETGEWTEVDHPDTFTVPARTHERLGLSIHVPDEAVNGTYQGKLHLTADPKEQPENSGAAIRYAVASLIDVTVGGDPVHDLRWKQVTAADVEVGSPPRIQASLANEGNVRDTASIEAAIQPVGGADSLAEVSARTQLDPGETGEVDLPFEQTLAEGQYEVHVRSSDGDGLDETVTFKVVPPGTLGKDGTLRYIQTPSWVEPGKPIKVNGVFENTGNATIAGATLTIEVFREGDLVGVIETEPRIVAPGERADLSGFFTPDEPGRYELRGSVLYDGFQTEGKGSIVQSQSEASQGGLLAAIPSWVIYVSLAAKVGGYVAWRRWKNGRDE